MKLKTILSCGILLAALSPIHEAQGQDGPQLRDGESAGKVPGGPRADTGIAEAFFTTQSLLPQTLSKEHLVQFLSTEHLEYHLDGWFFYGNLIEGRGRPSDDQVNGFFIAIQRMDVAPIPGTPFRMAIFPCIVGFNSASLDRYLYGGGIDLAPQISVTADPWSVVAVCPNGSGGHPSFMSMSLLKGEMGMKGAVYHLASDVEDQEGHRLQTDVWVKDVFGVVNQGYGPSSFFPQWILPDQRAVILAQYGGSVGSYLFGENAPMSCQGSYYYSEPTLKVLDFKITRDYDEILAEGSRGKLWMDYVVQSYNDDALAVIDKCSWFFSAIQFSGYNKSMMIYQLETQTSGTLPIAELFQRKKKEANGATSPKYCWDIDKIDLVPVEDSVWESPASGLSYYMEYNLILRSDIRKYNGNLTLAMLRDNQEICIAGSDPKYEGVATVTGRWGARKVKGYAWVELQPLPTP